MARRQRLPNGVWWVALGFVATLLLVSARYGFHRDELYFLTAGRRLAWGYVDQPPLVPLIARLSETIGGTNPVAIRVLPALALGGVSIMSASLVQRFGGRPPAQIAAAVVGAGFGFALAVGHLLSTATFDLFFGVLALWILTRLLDGADPKWWLALGGVVGIGLLNKYLIGVIVVTAVLGMVFDRTWQPFATVWPWAGGALAALIVLPNLLWQANNGWPQLEMSRALADRSDGPIVFVLEQVLLLSVVLVIPAALGLWRLLRAPGLRRWRPIAIGFIVALVLFLIAGGKAYYVAPYYPMLLAAGLAGADLSSSRRNITWLAAGALGIAVGTVIALPLVPRDWVRYVDATGELGETVGWEELVDQVDAVYTSLPAEQRADAVIFTGSYGQAGAVEILGGPRGLPPSVSGHNNYWLWGPPEDHGAVIALGPVADVLRPICPDIVEVGRITNPWGVENEEAGNPIFLCSEPTGQLSDIWDSVRHYN